MLAQHSSASVEWYTPEWIIELARKTMGRIDLDPASNPEANKTIKAGCYYTKEQNGLTATWFGNVWLNPPYCKEAGKWIKLAIEKLLSGEIPQLMGIVNATPDVGWFQDLWQLPLCFLKKRVKFWRPSFKEITVCKYCGTPDPALSCKVGEHKFVVEKISQVAANSPTHGSVIFYGKHNPQNEMQVVDGEPSFWKFAQLWRDHGRIVIPASATGCEVSLAT